MDGLVGNAPHAKKRVMSDRYIAQEKKINGCLSSQPALASYLVLLKQYSLFFKHTSIVLSKSSCLNIKPAIIIKYVSCSTCDLVLLLNSLADFKASFNPIYTVVGYSGLLCNKLPHTAFLYFTRSLSTNASSQLPPFRPLLINLESRHGSSHRNLSSAQIHIHLRFEFELEVRTSTTAPTIASRLESNTQVMIADGLFGLLFGVGRIQISSFLYSGTSCTFSVIFTHGKVLPCRCSSGRWSLGCTSVAGLVLERGIDFLKAH